MRTLAVLIGVGVLSVILGSPRVAVGRDLEALLRKGDSLFYETRYYEALDVARDAMDWYPGSVRGRSFLGQVLFRLARFEEARERFEDALSIDPYDFWSRHGMGVYYLTRGEPEHAIPEFEAAHRAWPEHELPCLMLARANEERGRYSEAVGWMDAAIEALDGQGRAAPASVELEREKLAYLATRRPYLVSPGFDRTTVPLESGSAVITVRLGPGAEGRFLLDTACPRPLMATPEAVFRALYDPIVRLGDAGAKVGRESALVLLERVEIGELGVEEVPCLVTERFTLPGVDGVIGLPFLRRFAWSFDFREGEVTIRDPALDPGWSYRYEREAVVSRIYPGGPLMVPVVLYEERPAVVILDSAADGLSLDHEFFERELEVLIPLEWQVRTGFRESPHGATPLVRFPLPSVWLGDGVALVDVPVQTYALEGPRRWAGVAVPGVLGLSALGEWRVDLDFREQMMTLSKPD